MKFDGNNCNQLNAHWKISSKNKLVYLFVWFLNTNGFIYNNVMVFLHWIYSTKHKWIRLRFIFTIQNLQEYFNDKIWTIINSKFASLKIIYHL